MPVIGDGWDVPPEADSIGDFRWFKVRGLRVVTLVVLSHRPLHYLGHFYGGRMIPCAGEGCTFCAHKVGSQLRWVFAAVDVVKEQTGLMEVGRSVGLELRAMAEAAGKFRGLVLEFGKHSKSDRSRMEVRSLDMVASAKWMVLPIPDIGKALKLTWERGGSSTDEALEEAGSATPSEFQRARNRVRQLGEVISSTGGVR